MQVYAPISAVKAIYARENGQGMVFGPEPGGEDPEPPPTPDTQIKELKKDENKRPVLKVVKQLFYWLERYRIVFYDAS